jgi:hypothetical protein
MQNMAPATAPALKNPVPQTAAQVDIKTPDPTYPAPVPAQQNQGKPLLTDPAALVRTYSYQDSKSNLQKEIEVHGGTMEVVKKSKYETFQDAAEFASIPNCIGPDALKHDPPKVGPVALGGLLALPFLAHAALTGKCK